MEKQRMGTGWSTAVFLLVFLFQFHPAWAQDELSDSQVEDRLHCVHQMIKQGKSNADRWWTGWLIGYSAATVVQGAIGLTSKDRVTREDMSLGAATTFLGAVGQTITPLVPGDISDRSSGGTEGTAADKREQLIKAEKWLKELSERERNGRSWKIHAITGTVNLGSGLIAWLGFKRSIWDGVGNFVINTVVTEVQIWTQPTGAIHDYERYVKKYEPGQKTSRGKPGRSWSVNWYPGGLGITVLF